MTRLRSQLGSWRASHRKKKLGNTSSELGNNTAGPCGLISKERDQMRKGYEIFDCHGRKRDEDDDAPLRDGETLRVPMFMMDSSNSTPLQRAIAKHSHELGTPKLMRDARRRRR